MDTNHQNTKERILQKIRSQEISMRPKLYFTLQLSALAAVAFLILVFSVFIFNFLLFTIRINSHDALLGFGPRGFAAFLYFFPWELLALDIALIVALQWMLRTFKFGYQTPAAYLLLGLLAASALFGFALDRGTVLNDRFLDEADRHELGPFNDLYGHARRPLPPGQGVCRCIIVGIEGSTLTVQDSRSTTTLKVLLPPNEPRATSTGLQVGDIIFVAGDLDQGNIRAFGVHRLPPRAGSSTDPLPPLK